MEVERRVLEEEVLVVVCEKGADSRVLLVCYTEIEKELSSVVVEGPFEVPGGVLGGIVLRVVS